VTSSDDASGWAQSMRLFSDLEAKKLSFTTSTIRSGAILVNVAVPGERWEIEIFGDGHHEIEIFRSSGEIFSEKKLSDLWEKSE
jgi:hypothetical protein